MLTLRREAERYLISQVASKDTRVLGEQFRPWSRRCYGVQSTELRFLMKHNWGHIVGIGISHVHLPAYMRPLSEGNYPNVTIITKEKGGKTPYSFVSGTTRNCIPFFPPSSPPPSPLSPFPPSNDDGVCRRQMRVNVANIEIFSAAGPFRMARTFFTARNRDEQKKKKKDLGSLDLTRVRRDPSLSPLRCH